jgi:hypothetical protein
MRNFRRLLPYLLLNIFVSAVTILVILAIWDSSHQVTVPDVHISRTPTSTAPAVSEDLPPLDVKVIQIMRVYGTGKLEDEVVVIENIWDKDLQLKDWILRDQDGYEYIFPAVKLIAGQGAQVQINTRAGDNQMPNLYWGETQPIWRSGEIVQIFDPVGILRDSFTIP